MDYVGAARDLPAGTILQASDLVIMEDEQHRHWQWDQVPFSGDESRFIDHKVLVFIPKRTLINKHDVSR